MEEKKRGVFIVDQFGNIVFYFGDLHEISEITFVPEKIIGENLLKIFSLEIVSQFTQNLTNGSFELNKNSYVYRRKVFKSPNGQPLVYLEIEGESDESISFYSMLIHEIKNPLAAVRSLVQSLSQFITEDLRPDIEAANLTDIEDYFKRITSEIDRLNRLLLSVKYISKHLQYLFVSFDLVKIANNTLKVFETSFKEKNIELITSFPEQGSIFYGDPDQFQQIFNNLISNAIEAVKNPGGKIYFSLELIENRTIKIEIRDEGQGINKNDLDKIFKAFYTKKFGGMGIGLTVVKMLVKRYKGELNIESTVNEGTKVTITLPVSERSADL